MDLVGVIQDLTLLELVRPERCKKFNEAFHVLLTKALFHNTMFFLVFFRTLECLKDYKNHITSKLTF